MSPLYRFLRFFFWHFYHGFAWTYDAVASVVSLGRWNDWIVVSVPYVAGRRVLEIGHGPGHLQVVLRQRSKAAVFGLDESPQMGELARRRLQQHGHRDFNLTRGVGQRLPFPAGTFDSVVATFPTEYIYEEETLREVRRVLDRQGRFIVIPAAWIGGRKAMDRLAAWLFRITGQVPLVPAQAIGERLRRPFEQSGFSINYETVDVRSSEVLVVIAEPV